MTEALVLDVDRDVVASWVDGWALSRGVAAPVQAYGGFRIEVGRPDEQVRYVFAEASDGLARLSRDVDEPNIVIKTCAPPQAVEPLLADGWSLEHVNFMMTVENRCLTGAHRPHGYRYKFELLPGGHLVTAHAPDGELAASGRAVLAGSTAVFDQIVTHPDHRRRGLGRAVMGQLGATASLHGATKGCLVATPDGRSLYNTLGWRLHALITTAVRR